MVSLALYLWLKVKFTLLSINVEFLNLHSVIMHQNVSNKSFLFRLEETQILQVLVLCVFRMRVDCQSHLAISFVLLLLGIPLWDQKMGMCLQDRRGVQEESSLCHKMWSVPSRCEIPEFP